MAAIAYWCITRYVPAIQEHIQGNARTAVAESSVANNMNSESVDISVEGRTVTLTGAVEDQQTKDTLLQAAAGASGVKSVTDQITLMSTLQTASADASTNMVVESAIPKDSGESTEGTADTSESTETTQSVEETSAEAKEPEADNESTDTSEEADTTQAVEQSEKVTEESEEQESAEESAEVSEAAAEDNQDAEASKNSEATDEVSESADETETGEASDSPTSDSEQVDTDAVNETPAADTSANKSVEERARQIIAEAREDALRARSGESEKAAATDLRAPSFRMRSENGTLTLSGEMAGSESLLEFVQSAMEIFNSNYVVNSVQFNDDVAKAEWLSAVADFLPEMGSLNNPGIDIFETQITLSGEASSDQGHDGVVNRALEKLDGLSLVERIRIAPEEETTEAASSGTASETAETAETELNNSNPLPTYATSKTSTPGNSTKTPEESLRDAFTEFSDDRILFESSSDVLTEDSLLVVENMAALFAQYPNVEIEIDGHTDASGDSAGNLLLSQLRANAVRDYLVKQGITAERLKAYGFGDGVPVADNSTAAGRRLNRRIEFNF